MRITEIFIPETRRDWSWLIFGLSLGFATGIVAMGLRPF